MAKIGDGVPRLIDKAVDFMASSQAFMEYLKKSPRLQHVPRDIPQDKEALFLQRLEYYRQLYRRRNYRSVRRTALRRRPAANAAV